MSSRRRFATPANSPLQDCSPYSHAHARRESVGFVHRSRTNICNTLSPNFLMIRFATFSPLYDRGQLLVVLLARPLTGPPQCESEPPRQRRADAATDAAQELPGSNDDWCTQKCLCIHQEVGLKDCMEQQCLVRLASPHPHAAPSPSAQRHALDLSLGARRASV
jgi:hypothetical protein